MPLSPRPLRALALASTLAVAATTTVAVAASGPEPEQPRLDVPATAPVTAITADGRIRDMVRMGDRIFVRGFFDVIGPYSGSGMPLDPGTGERGTAAQLDGSVSVTVPDGAGGWYLGGDFEQVGDVETRGLAHVGADGEPDPDFTLDVDGYVSALAFDGETIWFGGSFSHVDGTQRQRLAAVDGATGDLTGFAAPQDHVVTELVHAPAADGIPARVYVGTDRVVALDPDTGATDPSFTSDLRGSVRALLLDGDRVLVGGQGLSALDAATGAVDAGFGAADEQFPALQDSTVHTLLRDGDRLYVGGDFDSLGGADGPLVSLDPETGVADPGFAPAISELSFSYGGSGVFDLTVAGGHLWAGGAFARVAGSPADNLAALDPETGDRVAVDSPAYNDAVNAVDASGDGLYVGGQFFMTDAVRAPGFAALDAETLLPIPTFAPRRNGYEPMVAGQDVLYLARTNSEGYGHKYGPKDDPKWYGTDRSTIRAVDPVTGAARADLRLNRVKNLAAVTTIGDELYVAQRLGNRPKFPRNRITVYSSDDGERLRRFQLPLPGYVSALSSVEGELIAAGSFRRFRASGQAAHLAAIEVSPQNGELNSQFDLHTHGPLYDIEVHEGDLFVSGLFRRVYGGAAKVQRPGLAKFDRSPSGFTGLVAEFAPPATVNQSYLPRLTGLGGTLMVAFLGAVYLDTTTGDELPDPTGGYAPQVLAAVADGDEIVYSAHQYGHLGGDSFFDLGFVARTGD